MADEDKSKQKRVSQESFPRHDLEDAMRVARAIYDNYAGDPTAPYQVAMALNISPTSSSWRTLTGASIAYGLTEGGYAADNIMLTDLGRKLVAPTEVGEDTAAAVLAIQQPSIMKAFFTKYHRNKLPPENIVRNVLVQLGLPNDRTKDAYEIIKKNGLFSGVIRQTKGGMFVAMDVDPRFSLGLSSNNAETAEEQIEDEDLDAGEPAVAARTIPPLVAQAGKAPLSAVNTPAPPPAPPPPSMPKQLFVAHGKNRKPLEGLKKILDKFKIPYKVAIDEPMGGRPISAKVAELMKDCSAGIFIFTKDELFYREKDGAREDIWRPSENVVYELGAASILWERKIIVLREDGVNFPSDFSDIGYIPFSNGEIEQKALEIFQEFINLGFVEVRAT